MDTLPLVLLGIRTALKEDISSTAAEMVNGTTLHLPGEFFTHSQSSSLPDPSDFINNLKSRMHIIQPHPPRPTQWKSNISDGLFTATHVFIRHDAVRRLLQPPYNDPYLVVKKTNKYFTIDINGGTDTVSIDCLKPAHLSSDDTYPTTHTAPPTTLLSQTTHSGRRVHFPQYLSRVI